MGNQDVRKEVIDSLEFANEFLKSIFSMRHQLESGEEEIIPMEVQQNMTRDYLEFLSQKHDLDMEDLVWGLTNAVFILLVLEKIPTQEFTNVVEKWIEGCRNDSK